MQGDYVIHFPIYDTFENDTGFNWVGCWEMGSWTSLDRPEFIIDPEQCEFELQGLDEYFMRL